MGTGSSHWHVANGSASESPDASNGFPTATTWPKLAELISGELRRWIDSLELAAVDYLEAEQYEDASKTRKRSNEIDALAQAFDYQIGRRTHPVWVDLSVS